MKRFRQTIATDFRLLSSILIIVSALFIGGTWAIFDYHALEEDSKSMHEHLLQDRAVKLKERVEHAANYIHFFSEQAELRLKQQIKERTYEAYEIAVGLVQKYKNLIGTDQLNHIVRDSLRNIRYNKGRGYFFAVNVNGTEELFADKPELEGQNLTGLQDSNGQYVVKDMLSIAKEKGEGFYTYTWSKPENERTDNIKISFVKYLPELKWVIGTGEYLEDMENDIKEEVINSLDAIYSDPEGDNYLFIGGWDGIVLSHPAKGKDMIEVQDVNGLFIVKELIRKAKEGGGFVKYVMPKLAGERPAPKLSYVTGIPEWQWFVGTGEYIDSINASVEKIRAFFFAKLKTRIILITAITFVILTLNLIIANIFSNLLKRQSAKFVDFFKQAASSPITIDTSAIRHKEFIDIGEAANTMLIERNTALNAFRDSEERFRSAFSTIPHPAAITRLSDERIIDVNSAFETQTGVHRNDAINRSSQELALWEDLSQREWFFNQLKKAGEVINLEADIKEKENITKTYKISAKVFALDEQDYFITIMRDISPEKKAEKTLKEADKMKTEFISTAAHELRTPLSAIMGFAEILINKDNEWQFSDEQKLDFISQIYDRGESLKEIIDDLLDISRIESGQPIKLNLEEVLITNEITKSLELFKAHYPAHIFSVDIQDDVDKKYFAFDRHRITQVLENLLSNAVKYSSPGSLITVLCKQTNHHIEIRVIDEGIGMTQEEQDKVFDKFFRADSSDTAVGGLGLGMSVVKHIIEAHQGTIRVDSEKGQGTTVTIRLPIDKNLYGE